MGWSESDNSGLYGNLRNWVKTFVNSARWNSHVYYAEIQVLDIVVCTGN